MKTQPEREPITVEVRMSLCDVLPFNELIVPRELQLDATLDLDYELEEEAMTVWPQSSGTIELLSDASPSAL